jgi:uridine kinase
MSKTNAPFIIGIAGGSGSGKTTITKWLVEATNQSEAVLVISLDDYYADQKHVPVSERYKTNYDAPNSIDSQLLIKHLKLLQDGEIVEKPIYDFVEHTRSGETEMISARPIIIVEGILTFTFDELSDLFDLKIFVDAPADIRILRRLKRDVETRGRTIESVINQYIMTVKPMHDKYVEPSKILADVIIPGIGDNYHAIDLLANKIHSVLM